jgi:hypothetical protein
MSQQRRGVLAIQRETRSTDRPEFRVMVWRGANGSLKTLVYAEPVDALAAAVGYLREGYQVRLGGETVAELRAESGPGGEPLWFPSLRDWRLLSGMLGRALQTAGFYHPAAEQVGRAAAERLKNRIDVVISRIERAL